ncbi:MAG: DUF1761 domain-containing protein [bacterium]|nr:DUF1761 domain-containing protein [bacterium]
MSTIHISMLAIIVAVVAHFILGFIWYTPLFGKIWAKELGLNMDQKPPKGAMAKGMIAMLIGNFLMAWVLAHNMGAWAIASVGTPMADTPPAVNAFMAAMFTWMGFFLPVDIGTVTWEMKSWKLFWINTGYHFASLLLVSMILVHM